jgi:hypothetical protein
MRDLQLNVLGALVLAAMSCISCSAHATEADKLAIALAPMTLAVPQGPDAATLVGLAPGLSSAAIREALTAMQCAMSKGIAPEAQRLAIVDYTRPSQERRLWIFDLKQNSVLFEEFVAHGRNSGLDIPTEFSNSTGSYQTSLGLFVTDETYQGGNGYSLNLRGLTMGLNDLAFRRRIVMHGADYVNPARAKEVGRLGRSLGCPAVRPAVARPIIDTLKEGQFLYAYGPGSSAAQDCANLEMASCDDCESASAN